MAPGLHSWRRVAAGTPQTRPVGSCRERSRIVKIEGIAAVTGAGQGIGLGVTEALAREGFDVLALVLEESMGEAVEKATMGASGSVQVQVLDVTKLGDFAFPDNLQVVVNNAGIPRDYLPVEMSEPEEFEKVFAVNFFGLVEVTRRAIPV